MDGGINTEYRVWSTWMVVTASHDMKMNVGGPNLVAAARSVVCRRGLVPFVSGFVSSAINSKLFEQG